MRNGMPARRLTMPLAVLLCLVLVASAMAAEPKNIIIMFADGAAPTQWDFGRYSSAVLRQQPFVTTEVVFRQGAMGLLTTSPHGAYVTDSAAAASAMSTGVKVANGSISIAPDGTSPVTVMEAAKAAGKRSRAGDDGDGLRRDTRRVRGALEVAARFAGAGRSAPRRSSPTCSWAAAASTSCRSRWPAASARTARTSSPRFAPRVTTWREIPPSWRARARSCSRSSPKATWTSSSIAIRPGSRRRPRWPPPP